MRDYRERRRQQTIWVVTFIIAMIMFLFLVFDTTPGHTEGKVVGRCPQWEGLLETYNPGWSVDWMSKRMWVESKCDPTADNGSHYGLLQVAGTWKRKLTRRLGVEVTRANMKTPEMGVVVAAVLFRWQLERGRDPYQPWGGRRGS